MMSNSITDVGYRERHSLVFTISELAKWEQHVINGRVDCQ